MLSKFNANVQRKSKGEGVRPLKNSEKPAAPSEITALSLMNSGQTDITNKCIQLRQSGKDVRLHRKGNTEVACSWTRTIVLTTGTM